MEKLPVTVMIYAYQAGRLDLLKKQQRLEEAATIRELEGQGKTRREARIIVARMRPEEWPSLETVVAHAVEQRLDEPDLAGPWRPLTLLEEEELALSGRWPGPSLGVSLSQRNYKFPSDLVKRLRTAAWRVSEQPLRELRERGLVGAGLVLGESERALRDQLAEQLYPVPRIVREALARYGPAASG
ncbi:hypothetical protein [Streptomyces antimycoticus]|uniref:hypothetical protein n=1 Tax=Streptomyces antimycoticus TaxID=68175 RepID=UPI000A3A8564|nr:hypothetical protein [Streptomyces antimycoticus]